ncbi:MAG: hypothetical protein M0P77_02950 [Firmicutes bacterium]|nr:hypothetical protein [Bacillota bacterium]
MDECIRRKGKKISKVLKEWFLINGKNETTPEEIMEFLYQNNIYKKVKEMTHCN